MRRRLALSPPRTARRRAAREGGEVEGATPLFWTLVRHRVGVKGDTQNDTFTLPLKGGRSLHSDPLREGLNEDLKPSHFSQPGLDGRGPAGVARSLAAPR